MSALTLWSRRDPFADFDQLVRSAFATQPTGFVPAVETGRDGDDAVVRVELPGLDAEKDVTVEVQDGRLVIHGERRDERTEEKDGPGTVRLREVRYGSFRRAFRLPTHVRAEAISASYDAGVLTVRVASAYASREAKRIAITAG